MPCMVLVLAQAFPPIPPDLRTEPGVVVLSSPRASESHTPKSLRERVCDLFTGAIRTSGSPTALPKLVAIPA